MKLGLLLLAVLMLTACGGLDVRGLPFDEASSLIEEAGEEVVERTWEQSSEAPEGEVLAATSEEGQWSLVVSSGTKVAVPDLVGAEEDDAIEELEALGLEARVREEPAREGPYRLVDAVEPEADGLVARGSTVTLMVTTEERHKIQGVLFLKTTPSSLGAEPVLAADGEESDSWVSRGPSFEGEECYGTGGYDDIAQGAQVIVRDADGSIVASANLRQGRSVYTGEPNPETIFDIDWDCRFRFTISDVPFSEFYSIESGRRGELAYSFDDLERRNWKVELTLGDE